MYVSHFQLGLYVSSTIHGRLPLKIILAVGHSMIALGITDSFLNIDSFLIIAEVFLSLLLRDRVTVEKRTRELFTYQVGVLGKVGKKPFILPKPDSKSAKNTKFCLFL